MKILTKEEEAAHYNATVKGGLTGGFLGLTVGATAVYAAHKRFPTFSQLTLPLKTFLVTSSGTFAAIVQADRASRSFELSRDASKTYKDQAASDMAEARKNESAFVRFKDWGRENRYSIVTVSWVASMGIALGLVGRNPYLSKAQKLVQARVYAQGLTLAVLIATAAFEVGDANKGKGRWETIKILDPNDPEHKHMIEKRIHHEAYEGEDMWRDMVAAEERKIAARDALVHNEEERHHQGKPSPTHHISTKQAKGKEAKDKIVHEYKSAGKVDSGADDEANKMEKGIQERQAQKQVDAKNEAAQDDVKVKDRGDY